MKISSYKYPKDTILNKAVKAVEAEKEQPQYATRDSSVDGLLSMVGNLPNPDTILKKAGIDVATYQDLLYDQRVNACVSSRKSVTKAMEWDLEGDDLSDKYVDFHKEYLSKFDVKQIVSEALDGFLYGYKPFEIIWDGTGVMGQVPSQFVGKPSRWFRFNEENNLTLLTKKDPMNGEQVPDNKFVVFTNNATYDNPYGFAELSTVFWPVSFRKDGLKWWVVFLEKYGIPWVTAKAPDGAGKDRIAEVADILQKMVQDAIAVVPKEYDINVLDVSAKSSQTMHQTMLEYLGTEIAISLLGSNLTVDIKGGSFAASQTSNNIRKDLIDSDRKMVQDGFQTLMKMVQFVNFGNYDAPAFYLYEEKEVNKESADKDLVLYNQGVRFTSEYYMRKYNLKDDEFTLTTQTTTQEETNDNKSNI